MDRLTAVPPAPTFSPRGFTLTEMAVVLVIVALLIGGMVMPMAAQQDIRARQETERKLEEIREALLGFAVIHGRLPRPATSATDGAENPVNCTTSPDNCQGFIPWATLGIHKTDAWSKLIRYSVTPEFANTSFTLTSVATRTIQTRDTTGNAVYLAGQASCTTSTQCVSAVIFSHGKDRLGTSDTGVAFPDDSSTNLDEKANNIGPTNYFSRTSSSATTGGGEFDDIVVWLPTSILVSRMISAGKLP